MTNGKIKKITGMPVFLFQVVGDGILLIDNNTSKRITFEAEALRKYHDWGYYLKRQMAAKGA